MIKCSSVTAKSTNLKKNCRSSDVKRRQITPLRTFISQTKALLNYVQNEPRHLSGHLPEIKNMYF